MNIKIDKQFKKDFRKANLKAQIIEKLFNFVSLKSQKIELPAEAKDHNLKGEWQDTREFHLSGDLLVIYQIDEENQILKLLRIGTHSQLFKKF
jgi:mRNA interferase YafQ